MTNPTDTNQASEDELEQKVDLIVLAGWRYGKQKEEVLNLIRTEKLKLLAEVREEAFSGGLSFELDDGRIVIEVETDLESITAKLEAEL